LLVVLLVLVLQWVEPKSTGRNAVEASVNKARVSCRSEHAGLSVRLSFSASGDSKKTKFVLVGCSEVYLRWGCWEAQLLGRSEGVQGRIHLPGSDTYILKEEFWPGVRNWESSSAMALLWKLRRT
jgi:hypothetical protein